MSPCPSPAVEEKLKAHIQAQQRRDSEISQLLGGITDETAVYITQLVTNLVITLEDEFNDADQTISWWQ